MSDVAGTSVKYRYLPTSRDICRDIFFSNLYHSYPVSVVPGAHTLTPLRMREKKGNNFSWGCYLAWPRDFTRKNPVWARNFCHVVYLLDTSECSFADVRGKRVVMSQR